MLFKKHAGLMLGLLACFAVPAWGQEPPGDEARPIASFEVDGTHSRGVAVEHGRAAISSGGDVGATERPVDVSLARGGSVHVCKGSDLHLAQDSDALYPRASDGLVFSLPRNGSAVETHYPTGKYSDLFLTPDLQLLVSGPGTAELKVSVDGKGNACVENAGDNAPYVTVSSRAAGGAYRVEPGQRVIFPHSLLGAALEGAKQPCGCEFSGVYETTTRPEQSIAAAAFGSTPASSPVTPGPPLPKAETIAQPQGNPAQGTTIHPEKVPGNLSGFVPAITNSLVTIPSLYARSQKIVFLSAAHKSWLRVQNMDAYLETDVLIMIFAVAITITLSVLIQAVVFVLLFRVCRNAFHKLVWAAEDVKEQLIPAAETAGDAARQFMPMLHGISDQLDKINHTLGERSVPAVGNYPVFSDANERGWPDFVASNGHHVPAADRAEDTFFVGGISTPESSDAHHDGPVVENSVADDQLFTAESSSTAEASSFEMDSIPSVESSPAISAEADPVMDSSAYALESSPIIDDVVPPFHSNNGASPYPRPVRRVVRTSVFRPKRIAKPEPVEVVESLAN